MKAKKALKRLIRVEALLSNVLDQYSMSEKHVREALNSAKISVVRARESISQQTALVNRRSHRLLIQNEIPLQQLADCRAHVGIAVFDIPE